MARWKEETKIERVQAKKPNGETEILVLESNPKNPYTTIKVLRKEKLCLKRSVYKSPNCTKHVKD